jgi:putative transposase
VGTLELRVPQDRQGRFSTQVFERYQRSEKALVGALAEMYVQGVSTRKVKAITEELCGHAFSASAISDINKTLDDSLKAFAERRLGEDFPYLILDARYERVREAGVIVSQAVLVAVGIDWDGRRQILGVELANRESRSSWKEFLVGLRARGLGGVELVVSDDHAGLTAAIREVLPEAAWQRCYVHFLRNALDHLPRKADDDCLQELRWMYDRRDLAEVRRDLAQWLARWQAKYPKLTAWVEDNIEETLTFYRLPRAHHKHLKSTNMLERLNQEIKRRTQVVRIFPNAKLPEAGAGAGGGDARELARGHPLSQHGASEGAQEGGPASCRLTAAGPGRRLSYVGLHADQARITGTHFAELDGHNSLGLKACLADEIVVDDARQQALEFVIWLSEQPLLPKPRDSSCRPLGKRVCRLPWESCRRSRIQVAPPMENPLE